MVSEPVPPGWPGAEVLPPQPMHLGVLLAGDRDRAGWWGAGRKADVGDLLAAGDERSVLERLRSFRDAGATDSRIVSNRAPPIATRSAPQLQASIRPRRVRRSVRAMSALMA